MFNDDDEFPMHPMRNFGQMHSQMMNEMNMMTGGMLRGMLGGPFGGMMGSPFGGMMGGPFGAAITDGTGQPPTRRRHELEMNPFAPFGGLFGGMGMPMMVPDPSQASNMFMSTSVMTIGPDGRPRVEQQTVRRAGDVTETKRRVDKNGESSMTIGHSIGERSHFIDKKRDREGNVRKQQRFVNLDEANAEDFDREFSTRIRNPSTGRHGRSGNQREIDDGRRRTDVGSGGRAPIVTLPEEEEPQQSRSSHSNRIGGPLIREISEEEAEQQSIPKRRRGLF
ncbi:unnamed protein product [Caenorhabditis sp. 36 PRJEB53466]|nr:unnamed protein product [Caenorhabditis sp. 36 PRJEB53466]